MRVVFREIIIPIKNYPRKFITKCSEYYSGQQRVGRSGFSEKYWQRSYDNNHVTPSVSSDAGRNKKIVAYVRTNDQGHRNKNYCIIVGVDDGW